MSASPEFSREKYLAAYKSHGVSDYCERVISELISSKPFLCEDVKETMQGYLGTAFQKLVNATPEELEVLERDDAAYGNQTLTLEEQKEKVLKENFNKSFQELKGTLLVLQTPRARL